MDTYEHAVQADAFSALYRQYFSLVAAVIRGRVSDMHEAEDLAMAVFELAWKRVRQGEQIGLSWLYRCARNVVGNEYQRRDRNRRLQLRLVSDYQANALVFPEERNVELVAAVQCLPLAERELVAMIYWYDLGAKEAADVLGTTVATVKMRISRIRRKLRPQISPPAHAAKKANRNG
ncbi:RNA polymerase sigma factor [Microbacterium suaedae]|uniref:RNA polymerase sigma factor n=1 Tax=Microbacterium suaedae TaxID=2067813 RepID=UPI0022B792C5|nr:sigma-70 family RNA polymerase sigma factor [Microbacterium suaedae]